MSTAYPPSSPVRVEALSPMPRVAPGTPAREPVAIRLPRTIAERLARGDIRINGDRPWDVRVYNAELPKRVRWRGLMGLSEAYVDGWWECDAVDELFARMLSPEVDLPAAFAWCPHTVWNDVRERVFNLQNRRRAAANVREHYDQPNDVFFATLDSRLQYTCGYWQAGASDLESAQLAKIDLICRKLQLKPGMSVLEIGSGWGGLAKHMAQQYGCRVVGYTLSSEQLAYAQRECAGLDVEFVLADYRRATGTFDRVVSAGMLEHVGPKNYRAYFQTVHARLKHRGLALIHFFASQVSFPNRTHSEVNWFMRYIFPGAVIPSLAQIGAAVEGLLVTEDLHNFGSDYSPTLMAWSANFERNWPSIRDRHDERFYRLWQYYLRGAAGAFRARRYQLWQFVFSKGGVPGGYRSIR